MRTAMNFGDFVLPADLAEARAHLKKLGENGTPVAGNTSLPFLAGREPKTAVDILRIGLDGIRRADGAFVIGATTRVAALQKHHEPGWVLDRVAVRLATQPIRNMSTLGGNIARVFPWADFPVALLALGAQVTVTGDEVRVLSAQDYFAGQPATRFRPGDLVTEVRVPALAAGEGFGYMKVCETATGFSLATVAVWLRRERSQVAEVRVALGAAVPFPQRWSALEEAWRGQTGATAAEGPVPESAWSGVRPRTGPGFSAEYIQHLAGVAARDALAAAWAEAEGGR